MSPQTGRALALTHTQAIVWQYKPNPSLASQNQPVYVKVPSPSSSARDHLPLGYLLATPTEPSLLLVMPLSGKIFFWESLSDAASLDASRQLQQSVQGKISGMMSGESVTEITEAEPQGFVLTFNSGRLAHLTMNDIQGKHSVSVQYLRSENNQSSGIFGSLRGVFSTSGWKKSIAAVRAGPSIQRGQRYIITATTGGNFQVWDLHWSGTQTLTSEVDLRNDLMKVSGREVEGLDGEDDVSFELLDFSLTSRSRAISKKTSPKSISEFDIQLVALTAWTGSTASSYSVVSLSLFTSDSSSLLGRSIKTYRTKFSSSLQHRPQLMVPDYASAAVVAFEDSFTVISLERRDKGPSSQLREENVDDDNVYDETVKFQKQKAYKVSGCVPESRESRASPRAESSCILAVHGFGLVRINLQSSIPVEAGLGRTEATASNKLEQAVFFGNRGRNFIDFSPSKLDPYSVEDIEHAALRLSQAIVASTSKYLPAVGRSMDDQLNKRAKALADLIRYIKVYFDTTRPQLRWQLLWNAEKVAAAQALWRWYDNATAEEGNSPKSFFAELIEAIPESLKLENQRDQGETDVVRHWFVHDLWRLEWVLPYSHEIIELLFRESVDEQREVDTLTKALMISNAVDIQLLTLESAFKFRESNVEAYGFHEESLSDGILASVGDFEGLAEFWTSSSLGRSSALVPERVRELADLSNEMAKLLAGNLEEFLESQEGEVEPSDIDPDKTHAIMTTLANQCPRQIAVCCQIYTERSRWLKSQPTAEGRKEGEKLTRYHALLRRKQIVDLTEMDMAERGVKLAERYRDMEALLDIFERESGESNSIGPSIPDRIQRYFTRFGTDWANAYFTRSFTNGKSTVDVLSDNEGYRAYLTKFLRSHPQYDKITWMNEITTERNYFKAASSLNNSSSQCTDVWQQKTMLSLSKLSLRAAEYKNQVNLAAAERTIQVADRRLELLRIQDSLYQSFEPYIEQAIDAEAAIDVVFDHYGINTVDDKPALTLRLRDYFRQLFIRETLEPVQLIDLLTLLHDDAQLEKAKVIDQRFFHALWILKYSGSLIDPSVNTSLLLNIVWRRLLISSDWTTINRTETKNDTQVSEEIANTPLFQTLLVGFCTRSSGSDEDFWDAFDAPSTPVDVLDIDTQPKVLRTLPHLSNIPEEQLAELSEDLDLEDASLKQYLQEGRLEEWYKGVVDDARSAAEGRLDGEAVTAPKRSASEHDQNGTSPGFNVHEDEDEDRLLNGGENMELA